jgi:hypothetical protein
MMVLFRLGPLHGNRFFDHANNVHPTIKFTHETKAMVYARIVVTPLFQMTFQFPKLFFGGLFVGADAFDSETPRTV